MIINYFGDASSSCASGSFLGTGYAAPPLHMNSIRFDKMEGRRITNHICTINRHSIVRKPGYKGKTMRLDMNATQDEVRAIMEIIGKMVDKAERGMHNKESPFQKKSYSHKAQSQKGRTLRQQVSFNCSIDTMPQSCQHVHKDCCLYHGLQRVDSNCEIIEWELRYLTREW